MPIWPGNGVMRGLWFDPPYYLGCLKMSAKKSTRKYIHNS